MNAFDQMKQAVYEAELTMRAADRSANDMASILRGRLHHVSGSTLAALKRELRDFNIQTYEWKSKR